MPPPMDLARWALLSPVAWNATEGYPTVGSLVTNGGALFSSLAVIPAITVGTTYTEVARWNDTSADYRTAGDADYTNFSGVSWCANRAPLNNVADPFPLNSATTYRLRYVPGGSATQAAAEIVGTPTQTHLDSGPGGGIWCGRFGTTGQMTAAFGTAGSNPHSPARFNGGTWILERQNVGTAATADWRATPIAASGTARYNHTGGHLAVSTVANSGAFPTNLTGTWRIRQVGGASLDGALSIVNPASGGVMDIRVGNQAQFTAAFGSVAITGGGNFELIKVANAAPADDAANWSQLVATAWNNTAGYSTNAIVTQGSPQAYYRATTNIAAAVIENDYRLEYRFPPPNAVPSADTARWAAANTPSAWSGTAAYAINDLATSGGQTYRATAAISGSTPNSAPSVDTARWASIAAPVAWSVNSPYAANVLVTSGGQTYISTTAITVPNTSPNSAPNVDTTRWTALTTPAWDARTGFTQNSLVVYNSILYRASSNISAPSAGSPGTYTNQVSGTLNSQGTGPFGYPRYSFFPNDAVLNIKTLSQASHTSPGPGTVRLTIGSNSLVGNVTDLGSTHTPGNPATNTHRYRIGTPADSQAAFAGVSTFQMPFSYGTVTGYVAPGPDNPAPNVDTANWVVVSTPAWSGTTAYAQNAIVSSGGNYYQASTTIAAPPSPNSAPASDTARWNQVTPTEWSGTAGYSQNAIIFATPPQSAPPSSQWQTVSSSGFWSRFNNYSAGSISTFSSVAYYALVNISGSGGNQPPPNDAARWQVISAFSPSVTYTLNAVVVSGGTYYRRIAAPAYYRATASIPAVSLVNNNPPASDTARWTAATVTAWSGQAAYSANAIVTQGSPTAYYRATASIAAPSFATNNPNPPADTDDWAAVAAWSATAAYSQGDAVTRVTGGEGQTVTTIYRARNNIAAPSAMTGYVAYATWNNFNASASPNNASSTAGGADYYAGNGATGNYRASLFVHQNPLTTGADYTPIINNTAPAGNYRLTFNPPSAGVAVSIIGTVDIRQPDNPNRRALVVSSSIGQTQRSQDMIDTFGSNTPNAGGTWDLERQTTVPGANTAPESDAANWEVAATVVWSNTAAYSAGDIVTFNNGYYRALNNIAAPAGSNRLAWTRRAALTAGNHTFAYDTDTTAFIWRRVV